MSKKFLSALGFLLLFIWLGTDLSKAAVHIPAPCRRDVFLTISGKIGKTSGANNDYEMTEREFLALPTSMVTTSTRWTPKGDFVGPLLSTVIASVEAKGKMLRLVALDDFSVEVDADYLEHYGTILATSKDDVRLTIRDFGPIFIMYPRDSYRDELDTPTAASYLVWQLCGIYVE